jgi:hypothetical protein
MCTLGSVFIEIHLIPHMSTKSVPRERSVWVQDADGFHKVKKSILEYPANLNYSCTRSKTFCRKFVKDGKKKRCVRVARCNKWRNDKSLIAWKAYEKAMNGDFAAYDELMSAKRKKRAAKKSKTPKEKTNNTNEVNEVNEVDETDD